METARRPASTSDAVSFKIFSKNNWAGAERSRIAVTYANGEVRHLAPEFKDDASALRYMDRFHSAVSRQE